MLDSQVTAREVRERLRNPPNGHISSELEIKTEPELRKIRLADSEEDRKQRRERAITAMVARAIERSRLDTVAAADRRRRDAERGYPPVERIIKEACLWFGVTRLDVISDRRHAEAVYPRHVIMFLARHHTPLSLPQIGARIGGRDHTTILSGVKKIQKRLDSGDELLAANLESLRKVLGIEPA